MLSAYSDLAPDPAVRERARIVRPLPATAASPLARTFNRPHVLAISQAICDYRKMKAIDGPLFIGIDTHALSRPAFDDAVEVLAANGVQTMIAGSGEFTPTPAVSRAILAFNHGRSSGLADGIVITPSHNPPDNGGYKYNPPNGGPAGTDITKWIEERANALLRSGLSEVKRISLDRARSSGIVREYDYLGAYVADLERVVDFDAIRSAGVHMGVDPLGGAGVHYWGRIAERYRLDLTVVNTVVDPQFAFMTVDWDGQIRMDPSSPYAMRHLIRDPKTITTSPLPATPTTTATASWRGAAASLRPTSTCRSWSPTCSASARRGARRPPSARPSSPLP